MSSVYLYTDFSPQVEEMAKEKKKKFIDFKQVVWHKSFLHILKSIQRLSRTGYYYKCFNKIIRLLFPSIFILSADYEEQYVSPINLSLL
jgi:Plavaka transposase